MSDFLENNGYMLSLDFGITEDTEPPFEIIDKASSGLNLTESELGVIGDFAFFLRIIGKDQYLHDSQGINYVSRLLNYYCLDGDNFLKLNSLEQEWVLSFYQADSKFIQKAVNGSRCARS